MVCGEHHSGHAEQEQKACRPSETRRTPQRYMAEPRCERLHIRLFVAGYWHWPAVATVRVDAVHQLAQRWAWRVHHPVRRCKRLAHQLLDFELLLTHGALPNMRL